MEAFKELCGVSALANITQCVLTLGSRVTGSEGTPLLLFDLSKPYPTMHQQGALPDALRKIITIYHTVSECVRRCCVCLMFDVCVCVCVRLI